MRQRAWYWKRQEVFSLNGALGGVPGEQLSSFVHQFTISTVGEIHCILIRLSLRSAELASFLASWLRPTAMGSYSVVPALVANGCQASSPITKCECPRITYRIRYRRHGISSIFDDLEIQAYTEAKRGKSQHHSKEEFGRCSTAMPMLIWFKISCI